MPEDLSEEPLNHQSIPETSLEFGGDTGLEPWQMEVDGMYRAIGFIHQKVRREDVGFESNDILALHRMVINDPLNPHRSGTLREVPVSSIEYIIEGKRVETASLPPDPNFLSEYFNEFVHELEVRTRNLSVSATVEEVIDLAAWAHDRLVWIHPFNDGNGRTARLLADFIFRKARLPYIRDWGAVKDEYKKMIHRSLKESDLKYQKLFLAQRLLARLTGIENLFSSNLSSNQEIKDFMEQRRIETENYLNSLAGTNEF